MILAGAALPTYVGSAEADRASRAPYESSLDAIHDGVATADLGHHASTTEFVDEVIKRVRKKLEVWETLG